MIKDVKKVTVKYNDRVVGYLAEIEPIRRKQLSSPYV